MDRPKDLNNPEKNNASRPFEINPDGSLGLLALGAVGIKAWRKKRNEEKNQQLKKGENE